MSIPSQLLTLAQTRRPWAFVLDTARPATAHILRTPAIPCLRTCSRDLECTPEYLFPSHQPSTLPTTYAFVTSSTPFIPSLLFKLNAASRPAPISSSQLPVVMHVLLSLEVSKSCYFVSLQCAAATITQILTRSC